MKISIKNTELGFKIGIILKGFFAMLEIVGGLFVYFINKCSITDFISAITQDEINDNPKDYIINRLISMSQQLSLDTQYFISFYMLSHGIIKTFLIIALLRKKSWSYPTSIVAFSLFTTYQLYRYTFTHSPWLLLISTFDIAVIWFVWKEYKIIKTNKFVIATQKIIEKIR